MGNIYNREAFLKNISKTLSHPEIGRNSSRSLPTLEFLKANTKRNVSVDQEIKISFEQNK